MQTVLTIAGFDPSSGAGVTADLAVFAAHGLFGTSCITALTVQNTLGVEATHAVDAAVIRATLACLWEDLPAAGIKIGMLATEACVEAIAEFLAGLEPRPVVVLDPVMRSSSGRELLDADGVETMRTRLMPLVDWITPNLDELAVLTGLSCGTADEAMAAGQALRRMYPGVGLVVTGGHRDPPDDLVLFDEGEHWLAGERIETTSTHGTGCAFSSALLSRLVLGDGAVEAARAAKGYVAEALRRSTPMGHGRGPMNHRWTLTQR